MAAGVLFHEPIFATVVESGDKIYFYEDGTTTEINVYTDGALTTLHTQPIVADANGRFAAIYLKPSLGDVKVKLTDSDDVEKWTVDPYPTSDVSTISSDLDAAEADITSLQGRMTAAEADIDTNETDIAAHDTRLDTLEALNITEDGDFSYTFASSGGASLPGGLEIRWGRSGALSMDTSETVNFSSSFPTACLRVICCTENSTDSDADQFARVVTFDADGVKLRMEQTVDGGQTGTNYASYIAIGH